MFFCIFHGRFSKGSPEFGIMQGIIHFLLFSKNRIWRKAKMKVLFPKNLL